MQTPPRPTRSRSRCPLHLSAVAVAVLTACSYENDLDQLCRIAGELEVDTTVAYDDKMREALERWQPFTPRGARLHHEVSRLPVGQVDDAIGEDAYHGWTCPSLNAIGSDPSRSDPSRSDPSRSDPSQRREP